MSRSQARTDAFYRLGETCPKVKEAMRDTLERVLAGDDRLTAGTDPHAMAYELADTCLDAAHEHGTDPLRNALIECEGERLKAERERDDLAEEVKTFKRRIDELETEVADAQGERDEANQRAYAAEAQVT